MSFYGRYGAFAGGAPELFPGGPQFMGGDDQGVFYGGNTQFVAGSKQQGYPWTPASTSWQRAASQKWIAITGPNASMADSAFHDEMVQQFTTLLNSFYMAVGNHSMLGYSPDATQQVVSVGNQLKTQLKRLIAYVPKPDPLQAEPDPTPTATTLDPATGTITKQAQTYPSTTSGGTALSTYGATGGPAPAPSDNTTLYIAIAGGVAVLGGILFLTRRKPAATAGYRRRRR